MLYFSPISDLYHFHNSSIGVIVSFHRFFQYILLCYTNQPILFSPPIRWTPSPSILSMAHWPLWAQMDASASGTKTPALSWRPRSSSTSQLQLAASTIMATYLHMLLVTTGRRYEVESHRRCLPCLFMKSFHFEPSVLQGHEYYNPQKKNYIFLRNAAEELKPRNKKWWEKGSRCPLPWRPWSSDGAAPFPQSLWLSLRTLEGIKDCRQWG